MQINTKHDDTVSKTLDVENAFHTRQKKKSKNTGDSGN